MRDPLKLDAHARSILSGEIYELYFRLSQTVLTSRTESGLRSAADPDWWTFECRRRTCRGSICRACFLTATCAVNPAVHANGIAYVLKPGNPDRPEIIEISMTKKTVSEQQTSVSTERANMSLVDSELLPFLKGWRDLWFSSLTSKADFERLPD
jgi:hypothetical protein